MPRYRLRVFGSVQGVGFRPFVYRLATEMGLKGFVLNDPSGVLMEVEGPKEVLDRFLVRLREEKPPLAHLFGMELEVLPEKGYSSFEIRKSGEEGKKEVFVLPDVATCEECLAEVFDPSNRRYRYPFTNCTNCGPRFSIILRLPYDRRNTTMAAFEMCERCRAEYENPADRRFHAQPNACPECGPWLELWDAAGQKLAERDGALRRAVELLKEGKVLAVKGLGGFHLVCDATNEEAVRLLRERKRRGEKPFAVMFRDLDQLREYAETDPFEEALLLSPESPIVLVRRREGSPLAPSVAPRLKKVGAFLPYTPLHHLLLRDFGGPLVMTSANLSDEPIVKDNGEALERLAGLADYLLVHNRPIANRVDDSVVRAIGGRRIFIRRSRGFAPMPITLPFRLRRRVLAVGGHKKSVVAIAWEDKVVLSQHVGDLDTVKAREFFEEAVNTLKRLYEFEEEVVVCDLHPRYASTAWAERYSREAGKPLIKVQHHFAHALSLMADAGLGEDGALLAATWDGTGYGTDGTVWGGEFLRATYSGFERLARLRPLRLLGGDRAVKEPRRVAFAVCFDLFGEDLSKYPEEVLKSFGPREAELALSVLKRGINSPLASSAGRLFDAAAALLGILSVSSYEGQSGSILEDLYDPSVRDFYPFGFDGFEVDWRPLFEALIGDRSPLEVRVSRFVNALAQVVKTVFDRKWEGERLGLTGGVFQNKPLTERVLELLKGREVLLHQKVPPGDGGLALGQAVFAGLT
ncbi:MAG: carbamoyltransferase HypF [Aquificae bacterium]|nr:carbamoyltransferase HypF [Aquificota bacterium]